MNKVMLVGRLTRDPDLRTMPSGKPLATVSVADYTHAHERIHGSAGRLPTEVTCDFRSRHVLAGARASYPRARSSKRRYRPGTAAGLEPLRTVHLPST